MEKIRWQEFYHGYHGNDVDNCYVVLGCVMLSYTMNYSLID
jgi:hypothetical protein